MRFLLILILISFLSCESNQDTQKINKEIEENGSLSSLGKSDFSSLSTGTNTGSFLDSVIKKYELSMEQMRNRTLIDTLFYTRRYSNAVFTGDTVLVLFNNFKAAIIDLDDRMNCSYKFIFIFSPTDTINTDYKQIYNDCDRDESADFFSLSYKIVNDSTFKTIESFIPKYQEKVTQSNEMNWRINKFGKIDLVR